MTVKVNVPLVSVVAVPVPTLHLPVTVAPAIAKPVAAVPVTVRVVDVGVFGESVETVDSPVIHALANAMSEPVGTLLTSPTQLDVPVKTFTRNPISRGRISR